MTKSSGFQLKNSKYTNYCPMSTTVKIKTCLVSLFCPLFLCLCRWQTLLYFNTQWHIWFNLLIRLLKKAQQNSLARKKQSHPKHLSISHPVDWRTTIYCFSKLFQQPSYQQSCQQHLKQCHPIKEGLTFRLLLWVGLGGYSVSNVSNTESSRTWLLLLLQVGLGSILVTPPSWLGQYFSHSTQLAWTVF